MSDGFREECPWCAHTFYGEQQFEAHLLSEGAIERGLQLELPFGSVRNNEGREAVEESKKDGVADTDNPFGDWDCG